MSQTPNFRAVLDDIKRVKAEDAERAEIDRLAEELETEQEISE